MCLFNFIHIQLHCVNEVLVYWMAVSLIFMSFFQIFGLTWKRDRGSSHVKFVLFSSWLSTCLVSYILKYLKGICLNEMFAIKFIRTHHLWRIYRLLTGEGRDNERKYEIFKSNIGRLKLGTFPVCLVFIFFKNNVAIIMLILYPLSIIPYSFHSISQFSEARRL